MERSTAPGTRVRCHSLSLRPLSTVHGGIDRAPQLVGRGRVYADAPERFNHLVVAGAFDEHGRRRIGAVLVDIGAAIDAVIVENDDADGKPVAADRLDFHAGEAERRVAFDAEHGLAGLDGRTDGITHADAHHAPGADVDALARLIHIDNAAG